jgi:hypothetical protein
MTWQLFDRQVAHPLDGKRGSKSLENRERQRELVASFRHRRTPAH